jgi:acetyl esterase/lipase
MNTTRIVLSAVLAATLGGQEKKQQGPQPPFVLPERVEIKKDIEYARAGERALLLDLFLPKEGAGPFPAVVYVHGGGWSGGNKSAFHRQAAHMATKGFAGACIQYRLSGEAKYPAALHDVKAAVRWLRANAKQYKIRADRIGATGGSAGGHLVSLLALTAGKAELEGKVGVTGVSSAVQAVAAFNPALDLTGMGKAGSENAQGALLRFLGKSYNEAPELYKEASPFTHVNAKAPPFLFLHGTADQTVAYEQSVMMQHELHKAGRHAELMTATGAEHGFFNRPPWFEPTLQRMEQFFISTLKTK